MEESFLTTLRFPNKSATRKIRCSKHKSLIFFFLYYLKKRQNTLMTIDQRIHTTSMDPLITSTLLVIHAILHFYLMRTYFLESYLVSIWLHSHLHLSALRDLIMHGCCGCLTSSTFSLFYAISTVNMSSQYTGNSRFLWSITYTIK